MQREQFLRTAECEARHWWFAARRKILRQVIAAALRGIARPLVVDVGCGTGGNAAALALEFETVGIDPSPEAIGLARERYPATTLLCGHAPEGLGELAGRADLFLLADVLEHVPDDRALLARLIVAARPGAQFVITVPAGTELWSPHDVSHGHYRRYERESLAALWRGLPLHALGVTYFNARLYGAVRAARLLSRLRGSAWGAANTDLGRPPEWLNGLLRRLFAGEAERIVRAALGDKRAAYRRGVSLLALLRRVETCPRQDLARGQPLRSRVP